MVRLQSVEAKRQREKRMVQEMVALYCRKSTAGKNACAPNAPRWPNMRGSAATDVRSWRQKPSAPTAVYTATVLI